MLTRNQSIIFISPKNNQSNRNETKIEEKQANHKKPTIILIPTKSNWKMTYLVESAEDSVGHVVVNHNGGDEHLVEIDRVGPQSLVDGIRLVFFGRCRTPTRT